MLHILQSFQALSAEERLEILEKMIPGMKDLWDPFKKTMQNIWPVIKNKKDVIENLMDTFRDILVAVERNKEVNDTDIIEWGKALRESGGQHFLMWAKAIQDSPIKDLQKAIQMLDLGNLEKCLDAPQINMLQEVRTWALAMLTVMQEFAEKVKPQENLGWFDQLSRLVNKIF